MIIDEVVCGYIPSTEQVAKCADRQNIKDKSLQRPKVLAWLQRIFPQTPPILVNYPRLQDPRLSPIHILFCTRIVRNAPRTYQFEETPDDKDFLEDLMNSHPSVRILMTGAQFVTVPDPAGNVVLPGEEGDSKMRVSFSV